MPRKQFKEHVADMAKRTLNIGFLRLIWTKFMQNVLRNLHKTCLMASKNISSSFESNQYFGGRKIRFPSCMNAESIDDMKLRMKNHYAVVLNQAPSENLVKDTSEFFLTNKSDYSFTITEIRTVIKTSKYSKWIRWYTDQSTPSV